MNEINAQLNQTIMVIILGLTGGLVVSILLIVLIIKLFLDRKAAANIISGKPQSKSLALLKKYPEYDLKNYRSVFFRIGLVFAISLTIVAFSYTTYDKHVEIKGDLLLPEEIEIEPPITKREPPPPPPPPIVDIKIKPPDEIIDDDIKFETVEIDQDFNVDLVDVSMPDENLIEDDAPVTIAEEMPVFPGGDKALLKYLAATPYPSLAKDNWIEGTVYVKFVVDKNGDVTDVAVARGSEKILNKAAVAHIKQMPRWAPGKQRGKPVNVQFVVPIRFELK